LQPFIWEPVVSLHVGIVSLCKDYSGDFQ